MHCEDSSCTIKRSRVTSRRGTRNSKELLQKTDIFMENNYAQSIRKHGCKERNHSKPDATGCLRGFSPNFLASHGFRKDILKEY